MAEATTIYHGRRSAPVAGGASEGTPVPVVWRPAAELLENGRAPTPGGASVLLVDHEIAGHAEIRELPRPVVVVATDRVSAQRLGERVDLSLADVAGEAGRACLLDAACRLATARWELARVGRRLDRTEREFDVLSQVGMALMHEHDRNALLDLIVSQVKQLTSSDGGGLLFVEHDADGEPMLRPVVYDFDSLPEMRTPDICYRFDGTSVVGYVAMTRRPLVIDDASELPPEIGYVTSTRFQQQFGYTARSILAVPMIDQQNRLLGVLFAINRKADPDASLRDAEETGTLVLGYTEREVRLVKALASLAAMSIENAQLYARIEQMLESLVTALVSAIDERDPSTAGHSIRVATLTVGLAEALERAGRGRYRDVRFTREQFRELRFAALLHDLGKVAVREDVLVKAKKLPPILWERITARFDLIQRTLEMEACRDGAGDHLAERLAELARYREIVRAANEPTIAVVPPPPELLEIARRTFRHVDGSEAPYLMPDELRFLQLTRGTLDEHERAEIESHVTQTYRFLRQIPWTDDLKNLALYARGHHEKLDGSGYPKGLRGDAIPLQTRMITLADIFDALTEADRPYKPAVSPERALDIIRQEARAGKLDADLVTILTESQVYRAILPGD